MANCFLIEKELGHHRADWYIDSRIATGADLPKPFASEMIDLLPKKEPRIIHMFKGHINGGANPALQGALCRSAASV